MEKKLLSPKVQALYQAVVQFFEEGADLGSLTVSEIASRAGIGKGTVYEYFSNKEEVIANALYHKLQEFCRELESTIEKEDSFYDKMQKVLECVDSQMQENSCFLQLLQIKDNNSEVGRKLQELLHEGAEEDMLITGVIRRMIEEEVTPQILLKEECMAYLTMMVFAKLVCYGMYQSECPERPDVNPERMRRLLCRGICHEIDYYKEKGTWESVIS